MTPLICTVGQALYGPHWVRPLAKALGVSERTMRYWQDGTREPSPGVWGDLARMCAEHSAVLTRMSGDIQPRL